MNVKFAAGAVSAVAMVVVLAAKRLDRLIDESQKAATVRCELNRDPVAPNEKAEAEFDKFIRQPDRLVVVVFYADWCFPCIDTKPRVESIATEFSKTAVVKCIDIDRAGSLLTKYRVKQVPDVRFFRMGTEVASIAGAVPDEEIREKFLNYSGNGLTPEPIAAPAAQPVVSAASSRNGNTFEPMKKNWRPAGMQKR